MVNDVAPIATGPVCGPYRPAPGIVGSDGRFDGIPRLQVVHMRLERHPEICLRVQSFRDRHAPPEALIVQLLKSDTVAAVADRVRSEAALVLNLRLDNRRIRVVFRWHQTVYQREYLRLADTAAARCVERRVLSTRPGRWFYRRGFGKSVLPAFIASTAR